MSRSNSTGKITCGTQSKSCSNINFIKMPVFDVVVKRNANIIDKIEKN